MGKKILFGCLATVALVMVVGVVVAVITVPRLYKLAREEISSQMEKETARRKLSQTWKVPAKDAATDEVFPQEVAGYSRIAADQEAELTVFEFDPPGHHATYESGDREIDVFLYHVPNLERQALLRRMKDAYDVQGGGMKARTELDYRAYIYLNGTQYHVWWSGDCVVVVRAEMSEDQEGFVTDFLRAQGDEDVDTPTEP